MHDDVIAALGRVAERCDNICPTRTCYEGQTQCWGCDELDADAATLRALADLLRRGGWRDIASDPPPDDEDGVLICEANKPRPYIGTARFGDGQWRGYDHGMGIECFYPTPTHWQPLPIAPPTKGNDDAE